MSGRLHHRVAVLMGGWSVERDVSLVSGRECAAGLRKAGYEAIEIDAMDGPLTARALQECAPDAVFNALHGRWGEDGCVQGLLECLRLPYTHSGVIASALAMDKSRAKNVLRAAGLQTAKGVLEKPEIIARAHVMDPPYVVKPNNEGSSVGVRIVLEGANAPPSGFGDQPPPLLLVEEYIPGREMTCAVMGAPGEERALCVTEILTEGWYDYRAKYQTGGSKHVLPADIPEKLEAEIRRQSVAAHRALGCRGLSRADFRYDEEAGRLMILEVNTQPGMTPTSLAPEQAAQCGMDFSQLTAWLVEDASCGR